MTTVLGKCEINLKFSELTYCVSKGKESKRILKGVSGRFLSGQISAILGPSGAGKTTLMNILSGYKNSNISGNILVNEKPRCLKSFRKQSCYIMQDEHLLQFLTMQESMEAAAALKLGKTSDDSIITCKIDEILFALGLEESKNTRVSNLSAGEKKRLSIAFELINKSPVMFLDEPTSGLDSQNSYRCIVLLKKIAEEGRTIICTIHQPSARMFEKFDYVYALAEGNCIYRGSVEGVLPFISSISLQCPNYHNPADYLLEVASGEYGNFTNDMILAVNNNLSLDAGKCNHIGKSIELDLVSDSIEHAINRPTENHRSQEAVYNSKEDTNIDFTSCHQSFISHKEENFAQFSVPFWTQFSVLLKRTFRSILRDAMLTLFRLFIHIFVGIFVGILYYKIGNEADQVLNNIGYLYFSLLFYLLTAVLPTIITFPLETKILVREHLNNWYSLKAYYLAKTLADTPFQILFSFIFISIVYFMTDQPREIDRFLLMAVICMFNTFISQSIGLTVGAAFNLQRAVYVVPFVVIPPLLFSGIFIVVSSIPVYIRWLSNISYLKYCFEAAIRITYGKNRPPLNCSESFCIFKYPKKIMEQLGIQEDGLWLDFLMLLLFAILVRIICYIILRIKLRRE